MHRGQNEAALSIGMTRAQALRIIVLPQALRVVLPPLATVDWVVEGYVGRVVSGGTEVELRAHMLVDQTYRARRSI